jgi:hypothetical protein
MNLQQIQEGRRKAEATFRLTNDKVGYDAAMAYWRGAEDGLGSMEQPIPVAAPAAPAVELESEPEPEQDQKISRAAARLIREYHLDLSLFAGEPNVNAEMVRALMDKQRLDAEAEAAGFTVNTTEDEGAYPGY